MFCTNINFFNNNLSFKQKTIMPYKKQNHLTAIFKNSKSNLHLKEFFVVNKFISDQYVLWPDNSEKILINYKKVSQLTPECNGIKLQFKKKNMGIRRKFKFSLIKIRNLITKKKKFYNMLEYYYWFSKNKHTPIILKKKKIFKSSKIKPLLQEQLISKKQNYINLKNTNILSLCDNNYFIYSNFLYVNNTYQKFKLIKKLKCTNS